MAQSETGHTAIITDLVPQIGRELAYDEAMKRLFNGGAIVISGMSFLGEKGHITKIISILQSPDGDSELKGWCYQHRLKDAGLFEEEGLHKIDGPVTPNVRIPQTMFVLIAEVDLSLT